MCWHLPVVHLCASLFEPIYHDQLEDFGRAVQDEEQYTSAVGFQQLQIFNLKSNASVLESPELM
jgi:hypothetical protein